MFWIQVVLVLVQIGIASFSYLTRHHYRALYGIEKRMYIVPKGDAQDAQLLKANLIGEINELLKTGKYTILQFVPVTGGDYHVMLAQIKK